jgi:DNA-binding CsgD family transcriptional regulator
MMTLWEGLLARLGLKREMVRRSFMWHANMDKALVELAEQEKMPVGELLVDMVATDMAQRKTSKALKECWQSLTPREQEITALTCRVYTNRQMAARLGISTETIKTHLGNALRKFRMRRKLELQTALKAWDFSEWDKKDR